MEVITVADYFGLPELCERLEVMKGPDVTQNNNNTDVIRLDVCGTILKTTRATLTQDPHSHLAKMFTPGSKTSPPLTEEGAYFIDACPKAVKVILSSLRCRRLNPARNNQPYISSPVFPDDISKEELDIAAKSFALRVENLSQLSAELKNLYYQSMDKSKLLFSFHQHHTHYHLSQENY